MISSPTKHAVIGAGCSVASEPTAEVSHYYNITQVRKNEAKQFIIKFW